MHLGNDWEWVHEVLLRIAEGKHELDSFVFVSPLEDTVQATHWHNLGFQRPGRGLLQGPKVPLELLTRFFFPIRALHPASTGL